MINQVDGADTLSETDNSDQNADLCNLQIPVVLSMTRAPRPQRDAPATFRRVHRNEKMMTSSTMPVFSVANTRSLLPKLYSFIEKIENEQIDICLISEVWEKTGNKNRHFQSKIEEIMEMKGYKYISCGARPCGKRGGGAAILANVNRFSLEKLEVSVPHNLEVQWGIARPKQVQPNAKFREHVICSFYCPPASRKHRKLLDHLVSCTHALMARFPRAAFFLGGDKNSLPLAPLLQALPKFSQIVAHATHGQKIIDVLIMSCPELYAVPSVTPPVLPDDPRHGAPSDHCVPVARPLALAEAAVSNVYKVKTIRPLPDSSIRLFMQWIHAENWDTIHTDESPTQMVDAFQTLVNSKVDQFFPQKTIRVTNKDKEFITAELKSIDRKKMKEWRKKGRSEKYLRLKKEFDEKFKKASSDHIRKCVSELKTENPGKAAATLKKLGAQPGDCEEGGAFTLLNHIRDNLTVEEQIQRLTDHFVSVSQEFPPLELSQLSEFTRRKLNEIRPEEIPHVEDHEIFCIFEKMKKKKSSVPGDMPPRLFYESSAALAAPAARIMNSIARTGFWPRQYQIEHAVPLQKTIPAKDESQARLISCSNKMNIIFEKQVIFWLMKYVQHQLDPDQFGGIKGNSISHYLIEMTNFILYNQDLSDPQATIAVYLDYKQGFNRCQHSKCIEILSNDFNVPGWLLKILIGYLSGRRLQVRFKQKVGKSQEIPGGAAQGAPLGFWIFCFMIDKAGPRANPTPIGKIITQPMRQRKTMDMTKKKWVDDFTLLAALDLKNTLVIDPEPVRPLPYRSRTEHILPRHANTMQDEIDKVVFYSQSKKMVLNPIKTKVMIFNPLQKHDVLPQISTEPGQYVDVVEQHKILGQIVRSDMKTISNTENICKRAYKRMWVLRRLKALGCPERELLDVLQQQIISICEQGISWWAPMISKSESNMLERCLKTGLHIVYQDQYISFKQVLQKSKFRSLRQRRLELITSFSKKSLNNEKHKNWFCQSDGLPPQPPAPRPTTRQPPAPPPPPLKPVTCRTQRYARSSIPFITKLLSWHAPLRYTAPDLN